MPVIKKPLLAGQDDYTAREFTYILSYGKDHYPVTDAMESGPRRKEVWYRSQKEHVIGFLHEYGGPGAYGRKGFGHSARYWWNHFQCPPGLIWVAEAVGVEHALVEEASAASIAAEEAGKRLASQCAAIRRVIPWEAVYEATRR